MLEDETSASSGASLSGNPLYEFLASCLSHKAEMVSYESARAIVQLCLAQQRQAEKAAGASGGGGGGGSAGPTSRELASAVNVLGSMLVSPRPTQRFAAVRTLNQLAASNPGAVSVVNADLEAAVTDANRCIATLAITTLLKTGSETGVDRLMKQISSFMSEIADEFKVIVVDAIRYALLLLTISSHNTTRCISWLDCSRLCVCGMRHVQHAVSQVPSQARRAAHIPESHAARRGRLRVQARDRREHLRDHRGQPGEQRVRCALPPPLPPLPLVLLFVAYK